MVSILSSLATSTHYTPFKNHKEIKNNQAFPVYLDWPYSPERHTQDETIKRSVADKTQAVRGQQSVSEEQRRLPNTIRPSQFGMRELEHCFLPIVL